jgi:tetratricopeptide (TPR) repeat protein
MTIRWARRASLAAAICAACGWCVRASLESARALFDAGRYNQAAAALAADVGNHSPDPEVYYWLARCEFELREWDSAISNAEHAVQLSPNNSEYHHLLGRSYGRKAEHAGWFSGFALARKTREEFARAVELDPNNVGARRDLAQYDARAPGIIGGGEDKALDQMQKIAALDPVQGHLARKDFYSEKKEWDNADAECKDVLAANPREAMPYIELGDYYEHRENGAAILETLSTAKRNGVSDPRLDFFVGVAAVLTRQNYAEGEAALKRYLADVPPRSGQPSQSDAHLWLGRLYEAQSNRDQAVAEFRAAIQADPGNRAAHDALKRAGQ